MSEKLPDGWKMVKLGEVITINNDNIMKNYSYSEILYLDTSSITKGKIDNFQLYELKNAPDRAKRLVKENDIVYSTVRPIQRHYGLITNPPKNLVVSTGFAVIRTKQEKAVPKFIYYFLTTDEVVETLDMIAEASTSTYPSLRPSDIENLEILIPEDINEQKAIAGILSSLDDKIDLLHRQNKTLEEMAQTLFRKWFIEDAKEDWEEVSLGDFFPVITGKKNANYATEDGEYPFFTCSQEILKAPSYSFEGHAILLAGNGDFNVKRYKGKFEAYQRTYVLIPNEEKYVGLLYTLIKFFLSEITGAYRGSVIKFITKEMIEDFKFKLPADRNNYMFNKKLQYINELYEKIDYNLLQILTLEQLRDTLLPKLISGEMRVKIY
jgi:type I restriction enzyme S subunit